MYLLGVEDLAAVAVGCPQAEDVLVAESRYGAFDDRCAAQPLANVAAQYRGEPHVSGLTHQREYGTNALVGDEAEEGRLLELHDHALAQRAVEYGLTGEVREVG